LFGGTLLGNVASRLLLFDFFWKGLDGIGISIQLELEFGFSWNWNLDSVGVGIWIQLHLCKFTDAAHNLWIQATPFSSTTHNSSQDSEDDSQETTTALRSHDRLVQIHSCKFTMPLMQI